MENKIRHISSEERGYILLVVNAHFDISDSKLMDIICLVQRCCKHGNVSNE